MQEEETDLKNYFGMTLKGVDKNSITEGLSVIITSDVVLVMKLVAVEGKVMKS